MHPLFKRTLIAVIFLSLLPYVTGHWIAYQFNKLAQTISDRSAYQVQVIDYKRGWMHSTVQTQVLMLPRQLSGTAAALTGHLSPSEKPVRIVLEHEIQHGPYILGQSQKWTDWQLSQAIIKSRVLLSENDKTAFGRSLQATEPLQLESRLGFTGKLEVQANSPPFEIDNPDAHAKIKWQGLEGQWTFKDKFKQLSGMVYLPSLVLTIQNAEVIRVENARHRQQLTRTIDDLWVGDTQWTLEKLQIQQLAQLPPLVLRLLKHRQQTQMRDAALAIDWQLHVDGVHWDNALYGPLWLEASLQHLQPSAIQYLNSVSQQIRLGQLSSEDARQRAGFEALSRLLESAPLFTLKRLSLDMPDGLLEGSGALRVGGSAVVLSAPAEVVSSIRLNAHLAAPSDWVRTMLVQQADWALVQQSKTAKKPPSALTRRQLAEERAEARLLGWQNSGLIQAALDRYTFDLQLNGGQLTINGQPQALRGDLAPF